MELHNEDARGAWKVAVMANGFTCSGCFILHIEQSFGRQLVTEGLSSANDQRIPPGVFDSVLCLSASGGFFYLSMGVGPMQQEAPWLPMALVLCTACGYASLCSTHPQRGSFSSQTVDVTVLSGVSHI